MSEIALCILVVVVIGGVGFILFKKMKKGIKKTTDLHEDRKKNEHN
jgi:uncharacterized protein YneF (UPF0154 family)